MPGAGHSRIQSLTTPSSPRTTTTSTECGFTNLNSFTVPEISIGCSVSNMANEWCANAVLVVAVKTMTTGTAINRNFIIAPQLDHIAPRKPQRGASAPSQTGNSAYPANYSLLH